VRTNCVRHRLAFASASSGARALLTLREARCFIGPVARHRYPALGWQSRRVVMMEPRHEIVLVSGGGCCIRILIGRNRSAKHADSPTIGLRRGDLG
jgi:hypothetical protein